MKAISTNDASDQEKVAGIDCGLRNLAVVIALRNKKDKKIINVIYWDVIDLKSETALQNSEAAKKKKKQPKYMKDKDLFDALHSLLITGDIHSHLLECTQITVEKQMTQSMNRVAYMIYTMLSMECQKVTTVQFVSGVKKNNYLKKQDHVIEWLKGQNETKVTKGTKKETKTKGYKCNKNMSVINLKHFIEHNDPGTREARGVTESNDDSIILSPECIAVVRGLKKLDDLGDAFCYCCI